MVQKIERKVDGSTWICDWNNMEMGYVKRDASGNTNLAKEYLAIEQREREVKAREKLANK